VGRDRRLIEKAERRARGKRGKNTDDGDKESEGGSLSRSKPIIAELTLTKYPVQPQGKAISCRGEKT